MTVPHHMVGKVIAWIIAVSTCAQPVGQVLYGVLFDKMAQNAYLIFFAAAVCSNLIAWGSRKATRALQNGETVSNENEEECFCV